MSGFTEADVPHQPGKVFIVTGANTGIGFEASRVLAERGARVLLACRDHAKAEAAMAQIRQVTPRANLAFLPLDQADLASVRAAAELAAKEPRVDALINNAGVMTPPLMRTKQNFELQFGVNHLGTFALTALLLHAIGVSVEGELGCLGSLETLSGDKEDGHGAEGQLSKEDLLTDPQDAARFVDETQCDALAIAIGTSHGAYKFKRRPTGDILAIERIKAIPARLPNTHLVMHGSSSVPQNLLEEIRCYGGSIRETYGVPVAEIQEGIRHGVRKVNIDTDIRLAMTAAMRRTMKKNNGEFDPRKFLQAAMNETKKICIERFEAFGSAGHAPHIQPIELDAMAQRYRIGALRQIVH